MLGGNSVYGLSVYPTYATPAPKIEYELLQANHSEQVFYLLITSFVKEEPLAKCLNISYEAVTPLHDLIAKAVWWQVSYVAIDRSTGKVVGCRLSTLLYHHSNYNPIPKVYHPKYQDIMEFVKQAMDPAFEILSDAHVVIRFETLSVHSDYRRLGIAKRLVDLTLELARSLRCAYAISIATAVSSQKLFTDKLGFVTLKKINYTEYTSADGRKPFKHMPPDQPCAKLMTKKLF